jgi:exosortase/archaeosortase family protein
VLSCFTKNRKTANIKYIHILMFVGRTLLGYIILNFIYPIYILNSLFNKTLCNVLAWLSHCLLTFLTLSSSLSKTLISIDNVPTLYVCTPCSGLDFVLLLGILIISFPATSTSRIVFWIYGLLTIFVLNVFRISTLAIVHRFWFSVFEINHHLIFNLIVYGIICFLFLNWAKQNQIKKKLAHQQDWY